MYNLIELLIMIRLFPIILIVSQYFFAFLYLACCMCGETTERMNREQRMPQILEFLDEHVVPLGNIEKEARSS